MIKKYIGYPKTIETKNYGEVVDFKFTVEELEFLLNQTKQNKSPWVILYLRKDFDGDFESFIHDEMSYLK